MKRLVTWHVLMNSDSTDVTRDELKDERPNTPSGAPPADGELTDDDLEGVAGGANFIPATPEPPLDVG